MPTEREYREWKRKSGNYPQKRQKKRGNIILWLSVIIASLSIFSTIKNNPDLINDVNKEKIGSLFNIFNFKISSIKSLTEQYIVDIDEEIIPSDSNNYDNQKFALLDNKAKSIIYRGNSVTELADILSQYADTDLGKARIIYTWITNNISYDTPALLGLKNGVYPNVTVENVLNNRTTICSGYANLYQKLASAMGLKSVIVLGYGKGASYIVGEDSSVNHAWNAVKIDDKWHLIDTTWGAGTVNNNSFSAEFNPYYFLPPPDEFIYSHFPENPKWQLLINSIAREEFDNFPEVSSNLFKNNLELISHKSKIIHTNNRLNITLKAPQNVVAIAKLTSEDNQQKLGDDYTFVQKNNGYIDINTAFPEKGNYKLDIFAKKQDSSNHYPHALSYEIIADNSSQEFPLTYSHFTLNNGYLEAPLTQSLTPNQLTYFKLRIDSATDVKVVDKLTNQWTTLIKYGNLFTGSVRVGKEKIVIYAKFPGDSRYWALLEYN